MVFPSGVMLPPEGGEVRALSPHYDTLSQVHPKLPDFLSPSEFS